MNPQVEPKHYFTAIYDSKERFISYWHQTDEIMKLDPKMVLEIGVGNGFLCQYLKERGVWVVTLDIDRRLDPSVGGSVLNIPFKDTSFDIVACYEVLEHIPYEMFYRALVEIFRVSNYRVILSLPDVSRVYRVDIHIPKIGMYKKLIPLPRLGKLVFQFNGEHFWEIGRSGYPFARIFSDLTKAGFVIEKNYRVFELPYHRFLVLRKASSGEWDGKDARGKQRKTCLYPIMNKLNLIGDNVIRWWDKLIGM